MLILSENDQLVFMQICGYQEEKVLKKGMGQCTQMGLTVKIIQKHLWKMHISMSYTELLNQGILSRGLGVYIIERPPCDSYGQDSVGEVCPRPVVLKDPSETAGGLVKPGSHP